MDLSPLVRILADGGFHSGRSLGQQLGVTRTVVGQQIELLRAMGVEVHSVTGKGYRLPTLFDPLSRSAILHMMREQSALWASRFDLKFSTGSTNADAMEMARQGETRYLVLAEHQAAGRGRRGREWVSPLGANIAMSLLWTFELPIAALEGLSLAVATLVVEGLRNAGYKEGIGVKWPNDILLRGAKLAGILIEVGGETAGPAWVVIGIGINVRMPWFCQQQIGQAYTDLASNFELSMDRNRIVASVLGALSTGLPVFAKKGFAAFRDAWNELDVYQGRQVAIVSGSHRSIGLALGVTDSGALILDTTAGRQLIAGGELTRVCAPPRRWHVILDVDAGNTRIKWRALAVSGERLAGGSADAVDAFVEISRQVSAPTRVRIASVRNPEFRARLRESVMDHWGVVAEFAQSREQVGEVRNAYAEPGHLGVDRWLAVLAAYKRARGACCVLDAGSALTLDIVRRDGQHEGGYIVPGLTMQRAALLERTAIPLAVTGQWGETDPGRSTVTAIHHGILDMVVSWAAEQHRARASQESVWFITGGDAEVLSDALARRGVHCILVPELVLEGLPLALP